MSMNNFKTIDIPSVGAVAFLMNGDLWVVSRVFQGGFNAQMAGYDDVMSFFNRSENGAPGPYMPRGQVWDAFKAPGETMEDWQVMYFAEPYKKPHVYKVGDQGVTTTGLNYHVFRVGNGENGSVDAALWHPGEWVNACGYFRADGTVRMTPSNAKHQDCGGLIPPKK